MLIHVAGLIQHCRLSLSSATAPAPVSKGGSIIRRSRGAGTVPSASTDFDRTSGRTPSRSALAGSASRAALPSSTTLQLAAPRDKASSPSTPDPPTRPETPSPSKLTTRLGHIDNNPTALPPTDTRG